MTTFTLSPALGPSVERLLARLQDFPFSSRVVIADNASTDSTPAIAAALAREIPEVRYQRLEFKGRGAALHHAWLSSDAPVLAYMDVDLSTGLDALLPLVAPLVTGHSDVAIGSRLASGASVARGPKREFISRSYNLLLHTVFATHFHDAQCGFKAISRTVAHELLAEIEKEDASLLDAVGFTDREIAALIDVEGGVEDAGPEEAPADPVSRPGDIWMLGDHRIMCGDAAVEASWSVLLGDARATCIVTDPPYGVSIGAKNRLLNANPGINGNRPGKRCMMDITDDDISPDDLRARLTPVFTVLRSRVMAEDCSVLVTAPQGGELGMMMMTMMRDAGLPVRHVLIWRKHAPTFSMGRLDYDYQHEPILLTWLKRHKKIMGGQHRTSVWDIPRPMESKEHPTMKPIELYENAYLNHSEDGDVVVDAFAGSGTCFVAASRTRRRCYAMEISPAYVDVAVRRWERSTGGTALWAPSTGGKPSETFNAIARQRLGQAPCDEPHDVALK